jgi:hypothetical protein
MPAQENSEISEATKLYLENLISGLRSEIADLRIIVAEKNERISKLEATVIETVQRSVELAGRIDDLESNFNIRLDEQEQYTRKDCLHIEGITYVRGESNSDLKEKVIATIKSLGADIEHSDITRLHRSAKPKEEKDGRITAQTIVKFNNWSARSSTYSTRFAGSDDERKKRNVYVKLDLTRRRLNLLALVRNTLTGHKHAHAYANSECRIIIRNRLTKRDYVINSEKDLQNHFGNSDDNTT